MSDITFEKLSDNVGIEVLDVDVARLLNDDEIPAWCLDALDTYGVLLFRELNADDDAQVAFGRRLGELVKFPQYANPEVMEISFDPANPSAKYFGANDHWHLDGSLDEIPAKASIMSARVIAAVGGETEFASTYAAYDALTETEKRRFAELRVAHSMSGVQSRANPNPTPKQAADWARWPVREHPLVWNHENGRRSLVFGATAAHVVDMDLDEGKALLLDLEQRATAPDRVYRHTWTVGDMVMWDNRGLVHRACEFDRSEPRRMHRTTLAGEEAIG
ncbi:MULTISPECIES: TauD/TfdA dioxygenase family protein [Nocardia]|uniref:TauD/TfdA dioxygenase family protein n=1 Tax=Nocardia TaxID=1817 RepID=UPI000D69E27A|nr:MULTISPECIES: TauD/TfdA family dioxygenase [Nocardia]